MTPNSSGRRLRRRGIVSRSLIRYENLCLRQTCGVARRVTPLIWPVIRNPKDPASGPLGALAHDPEDPASGPLGNGHGDPSLGAPGPSSSLVYRYYYRSYDGREDFGSLR